MADEGCPRRVYGEFLHILARAVQRGARPRQTSDPGRSGASLFTAFALSCRLYWLGVAPQAAKRRGHIRPMQDKPVFRLNTFLAKRLRGRGRGWERLRVLRTACGAT